MNEHYQRFTERTDSELRQLISLFGKLRNKTPNQLRQYQAMQSAWLRKQTVGEQRRAPIIENRFKCSQCKTEIVSQGEQVIECGNCDYPHMASGQAYAIN